MTDDELSLNDYKLKKFGLMKMLHFIGIYIIAYYILGIVVFLSVFGFNDSLKILTTSPMTVDLNGTTILFSSLIASILMITLMRKRLSTQPYPYFVLGWYIGNLSLLFMFLMHNLLNNFIVWKFPELLLLFFAPFIELFFSYLFGFAFMTLIPSWLSAYILLKYIRYTNSNSKLNLV